MKQSAPIIVGIDFSESSGFVLRQAVHAGALSGSPVVAVHVLHSGKLQHWASGDGSEEALENLKGEAKAKLEALAAQETPDANIEFEVCVGRPAEELDTITKRLEASRLVIAANDTTKTNLGSIASRCVRIVTADVLIVRDWLSGDFQKIVVCTDLSAGSQPLIAKAIEVAAANKAALDVVHVIYPPDKDYWGQSLADVDTQGPSYAEVVRTKAQTKMDRCLEGLSDSLEQIEYTTTILESAVPSVELTYHINESGADLVVLGTRAHSKLASIFVGTNAERLMHDAKVSVLATRV